MHKKITSVTKCPEFQTRGQDYNSDSQYGKHKGKKKIEASYSLDKSEENLPLTN